MSTNEVNTLNDENRQRIAAEVLELGESLFDLALEHTGQQSNGEEHNNTIGKGVIGDEFYAAKGEFFVALRLLFHAGQS